MKFKCLNLLELKFIENNLNIFNFTKNLQYFIEIINEPKLFLKYKKVNANTTLQHSLLRVITEILDFFVKM